MPSDALYYLSVYHIGGPVAAILQNFPVCRIAAMKSAESGSLQNFEFVRSKSADCLHSADFRSDSADFRSDSADFNLLLC